MREVQSKVDSITDWSDSDRYTVKRSSVNGPYIELKVITKQGEQVSIKLIIALNMR